MNPENLFQPQQHMDAPQELHQPDTRLTRPADGIPVTGRSARLVRQADKYGGPSPNSGPSEVRDVPGDGRGVSDIPSSDEDMGIRRLTTRAEVRGLPAVCLDMVQKELQRLQGGETWVIKGAIEAVATYAAEYGLSLPVAEACEKLAKTLRPEDRDPELWVNVVFIECIAGGTDKNLGAQADEHLKPEWQAATKPGKGEVPKSARQLIQPVLNRYAMLQDARGFPVDNLISTYAANDQAYYATRLNCEIARAERSGSDSSTSADIESLLHEISSGEVSPALMECIALALPYVDDQGWRTAIVEKFIEQLPAMSDDGSKIEALSVVANELAKSSERVSVQTADALYESWIACSDALDAQSGDTRENYIRLDKYSWAILRLQMQGITPREVIQLIDDMIKADFRSGVLSDTHDATAPYTSKFERSVGEHFDHKDALTSVRDDRLIECALFEARHTGDFNAAAQYIRELSSDAKMEEVLTLCLCEAAEPKHVQELVLSDWDTARCPRGEWFGRIAELMMSDKIADRHEALSGLNMILVDHPEDDSCVRMACRAQEWLAAAYPLSEMTELKALSTLLQPRSMDDRYRQRILDRLVWSGDAAETVRQLHETVTSGGLSSSVKSCLAILKIWNRGARHRRSLGGELVRGG